jgi:hypothetical protein
MPVFAQKTFYVYNNGDKQGAVNQNGKIIIQAKYENIDIFDEYFICTLNDKVGVLNFNNKTVLPFDFDHIAYYKDEFIVCRDKKYGVINKKKANIIPSIYDHISACSDGYIAVKNKKYGFLDKNAKMRIDFLYDELGGDNIAYSGNRIVFKLDGKYGFLDENGRIVIPAKYRYAKSFKNGRAVVYTDKYAGTINVNGDFEIKPDKYTSIFDFPEFEGVYYAWGKRDKCLISLEGDTLVSGLNDDFLLCKNATIIVCKNNKYGLYSTNGKCIIPIEYDGIDNMGDNGLIPVLKNGKWGFINQNNEVVIDFKFIGRMCSFSEGVAVFYSDKFSTMGRFTSQKVGYINKNGEIVIPPKFDNASPFKKGRAEVEMGLDKLLINTKGEVVFKLSTDNQTIMEVEIGESN